MEAFHLLHDQESTSMLAHSMGNKGTGGHRVAMVAVTKRPPEAGKHLGRAAWAGTQCDASLCHWKKGSPSSSWVFSGNLRMGEKDSGREEGKCCSSLLALPKHRSLLPSSLCALHGKE